MSIAGDEIVDLGENVHFMEVEENLIEDISTSSEDGEVNEVEALVKNFNDSMERNRSDMGFIKMATVFMDLSIDFNLGILFQKLHAFKKVSKQDINLTVKLQDPFYFFGAKICHDYSEFANQTLLLYSLNQRNLDQGNPFRIPLIHGFYGGCIALDRRASIFNQELSTSLLQNLPTPTLFILQQQTKRPQNLRQYLTAKIEADKAEERLDTEEVFWIISQVIISVLNGRKAVAGGL